MSIFLGMASSLGKSMAEGGFHSIATKEGQMVAPPLSEATMAAQHGAAIGFAVERTALA